MKRLTLYIIACLAYSSSFSQPPRILVPFREGAKWGYSDTLGKIKIKPKYDTASLFHYNIVHKGNHVLAEVELGGKPMVINEQGAVIVPPKYERIHIIHQLDEPTFIVSKNGKAGVFTKGKELFPPLYNYMDVHSYEGFYTVYQNNKCGLINNEGRMVIPVIYDKISKMYNQQSGNTSWQGVIWGKEPVTYTFKRIEVAWLSDIPPDVSQLYNNPVTNVNEMDSLKKVYNFDSVRISNHVGIVYKDRRAGIFLPEKTKAIQFFSRPFVIHYVKYFPAHGRNSWNKNSMVHVIVSSNGKYGMINEREEEILPFIYESIEDRYDFYLLKLNDRVGFSVFNTSYPNIQPKYDEYIRKESIPVNHRWSFTLFEVRKKGKAGYVGENGVDFFKD